MKRIDFEDLEIGEYYIYYQKIKDENQFLGFVKCVDVVLYAEASNGYYFEDVITPIVIEIYDSGTYCIDFEKEFFKLDIDEPKTPEGHRCLFKVSEKEFRKHFIMDMI